MYGASADIPEVAAAMDGTLERFNRHFGVLERAEVLVVLGIAGSDAAIARLQAEGVHVLSWPTKVQQQALIADALRQELERQLHSLSRAQRRAFIDDTLRRYADSAEANSSSIETGVLEHEIAHSYFIELYDSGEAATGHGARYGSAAPDWIDELAAIVCENEALTGLRRRQYETMEVAQPGALLAHLAAEHPRSKSSGHRAPGVAPGGITVRASLTPRSQGTSEGPRAPSKPNEMSAYYTRSRALADFLFARTRDPLIVREIALHVRAGGNLESWLRSRGVTVGLGSTGEEFEQEFTIWLSSAKHAVAERIQ